MKPGGIHKYKVYEFYSSKWMVRIETYVISYKKFLPK